MINRAAAIMLILTSLAPVALVYAGVVLLEDWRRALIAAGTAVVLFLVCVFLLRKIRSESGSEHVQLVAAKSADKEILAFMISYLLPMLVKSGGKELSNSIAIAIFFVLMFVVLFQANIAHVNPLMGLMGYRFYEVTGGSGAAALLVTKRRHSPVRNEFVDVVRITDQVWLEVSR